MNINKLIYQMLPLILAILITNNTMNISNDVKKQLKIGVLVKDKIVRYEPLIKQKEFHKNRAKYRLYSGAFRAGKTLSGSIEGFKQSMKYARNRGVIIRQTYPELRDTTKKTFLEDIYIIYPNGKITTLQDSNLIIVNNKSENYIKFINNSEVLFRSADNPDKLKSLNLGWFYIDEATEVDFDIFKMLKGRLSLQSAYKRVGFLTTNPDNFANWVYKVFYEKENIRPQHYYAYDVIETNTLENKYLPEEYLEDVKDYDEDYYNRYIMGQWGIFEGLIYKSFTLNHILKHNDFDFDTIEDWYIGMDFGYENPTAILLVGIDYDGRFIVVDEFYQRHTGLNDWIKAINEFKNKYNIKETIKGWGDPSGFIKQIQKEGIDLKPAKNDVFEGIEAVNREINGNRLFILDNCYYTLKEIKIYKWRKINGVVHKEQPVKQNDHAMDSLRYVIYNYKTNNNQAVLVEL